MTKSNLGRKGFIWLTCYKLQSIIYSGGKAGNEAEAIDDSYLLTCFSGSQLVHLPGLPDQGCTTYSELPPMPIIN